MKFLLLLIAMFFTPVTEAFAQDSTATEPEMVSGIELVSQDLAESSIRPALLKAIAKARKSGRITPFQAVRLRVATFSPAFLERAQELAVVQLMFVEDGPELPRTETGAVDETAIDWEGLASFLERIIPLLVDLLSAFGVFGQLEQPQLHPGSLTLQYAARAQDLGLSLAA